MGTRHWGQGRRVGDGDTRLGWGHEARMRTQGWDGDTRVGTGMLGWGWRHEAGDEDFGMGTSWDPAQGLGETGLVPWWDLSGVPAGIWVESRLGPGRMWAGS